MTPSKLPMIPSKALVHVVETDVVLALDDALYREIQSGLPRIFRGMPDSLTIA